MDFLLRLFVFLLGLPVTGFALHAQELHLPRECSGNTKPFTTVLLIDKRSHQMVGTIITVLIPSGRPVSRNVSYESNLAADVAAYFGTPAKPGDSAPSAVLLLEDLYVGGREDAPGDLTNFKLALRLFHHSGNGRYAEVLSVDTAYVIKGMWIGKVLRAPDEYLCALADSVRRGGLQISSTQSYTLNELLVIDSLEKLGLHSYSGVALPPGVYRTYDDFKRGTPEVAPLLVKAFPSGLYSAYDTRSKPDWKGRIYARETYAIVHDSLILVSTPRGLCKMEFIAGDFYLWAPTFNYVLPQTMMLPHNTRVPGSAVELALLDGLSPSLAKRIKRGAWFYRINHRTGKELIGTLLKGKMR
jgi:hypothetical protein